jgi:hypothetical protein
MTDFTELLDKPEFPVPQLRVRLDDPLAFKQALMVALK